MAGDSRFEVPVEGGSIIGRRAGRGPNVLLLHGGPGLSDYLEPLASELLPAFTITRYQQRGVSPSTESGPFTVETHVADAVAVMDAAGLDRVWLVGHSWGGYLALHLALMHPTRVTGIVSIDPLGAVGDGGTAAMMANLIARVLPENQARFEALESGAETPADPRERFGLIWPGYFADPAGAPPLPDDLRFGTECNQQTWPSIQEHFTAETLPRLLPDLDIPVCFVLGRQSPIPIDQGEATCKLLPKGQMVVLDSAGHFPWLDQPGRMLKIVSTVVQTAQR